MDNIAIDWGISRPEKFKFIDDFEELSTKVESMNGREGICFYFNDDQDIKKLKNYIYLRKHAFKFHFSWNSLLDWYAEEGLPSSDEFLTTIEKEFDFECREIIEPRVLEMCRFKETIDEMIDKAEDFISGLRDVSRKEKAVKILDKYGKKSFGSFICFKLLDGDEISYGCYWKQLRKMIKEFKNYGKEGI